MILGLTVQVASDIVKACGIKNKNQENLDHMTVFTVSIEITCIKTKLRSETLTKFEDIFVTCPAGPKFGS